MAYGSEPLDPDQHETGDFACGEASLDLWLREQAIPATTRRTARTSVWVDQDDSVVGYYALAVSPEACCWSRKSPTSRRRFYARMNKRLPVRSFDRCQALEIAGANPRGMPESGA